MCCIVFSVCTTKLAQVESQLYCSPTIRNIILSLTNPINNADLSQATNPYHQSPLVPLPIPMSTAMGDPPHPRSVLSSQLYTIQVRSSHSPTGCSAQNLSAPSFDLLRLPFFASTFPRSRLGTSSCSPGMLSRISWTEGLRSVPSGFSTSSAKVCSHSLR